MSVLSSIFAAPGTSEAQRNQGRTGNVSKVATDAVTGLSPLIQSQIGFANQIEPFRQRSLWDTIHAGSPGGVDATVQNARNSFMGANLASLPMVLQELSRGGAGIGVQQGAHVAAINDANKRANDMLAWFSSPEGRSALNAMVSGAAGQAFPSLGPLSSLASIVYGRPAPVVGMSPLAGIASVAGQYFGAQNRQQQAPPPAQNQQQQAPPPAWNSSTIPWGAHL